MASQSFRNRAWRISYASDKDSPVTDFYIPALECAIHWEHNIESFHVFCAWESGRDLERVQEEIHRTSGTTNCLTSSSLRSPTPSTTNCCYYAPTTAPIWDPP